MQTAQLAGGLVNLYLSASDVRTISRKAMKYCNSMFIENRHENMVRDVLKDCR